MDLTRTGIKERRIADPSKATSDYAAGAARLALDRAGVTPDELDLIIVATVTPDMFFPSTACLVQQATGRLERPLSTCRLGAGLRLRAGHGGAGIEAGAYRKVLVIGADLLSRVTDFTDRSTCVLFGDGAGAVVVGAVDEGGVLSTYLGADGSGGEKLCIPAGGSRLPAGSAEDRTGQHDIQMAGTYVSSSPSASCRRPPWRRCAGPVWLLTRSISSSPIRRTYASSTLRPRGWNRQREGVCDVDQGYGNTSAASIPIALDEAVEIGKVAAGDILVLVGSGAGLTWGAATLQWNGERVPVSRVAAVFPGQGSQYVGMGKELAEAHPIVAETFAEADRVLGFSLSKLCFDGPEEELTLTRNTQPALLTASVATFRLLQSKGFQPVAAAGHSLGEYSALVAAGAAPSRRLWRPCASGVN